MKRGSRILLFLVIVIVILIAVAFLLLNNGSLGAGGKPPTPTPAWVTIITVGDQPISRDAQITEEMLSELPYPPDKWNEAMITNKGEVIGKYAALNLAQGLPLTKDMFTDRPGMSLPGSEAAKVIQPGMVAVSIPITRFSSVAYAIRDGDHVNVIATTMFVDLDSQYQSILPDNIGQVVNVGTKPDEAPLITLGMSTGGGARTGGRAELDPLLNQAVYLIPSEAQRPRMVSQMILQNIQVLHVGTFEVAGQQSVLATPTPGGAGGQAAPAATPAPVKGPDILTLIVTPQDAVALTYLLYNDVALTMTLRAPDDTSRVETEAATLQYLLSQYAIPVPAKLPYGFQPNTVKLSVPNMEDVPPTPHP